MSCVSLLTFFLFHVEICSFFFLVPHGLVRLDQLEPLACSIGDLILQQDRPALVPGRKHLALSMRPMHNAQAPSRLLVQVQNRSLLIVLDNLHLIPNHAEVPLYGRVDAEAIVNILVYAVGLDLGAASIVARDDAQLQLLEVFVLRDASDEIVVGELLGDNGLEVGALEQEGVVLVDRGLGDTVVLAQGY